MAASGNIESPVLLYYEKEWILCLTINKLMLTLQFVFIKEHSSVSHWDMRWQQCIKGNIYRPGEKEIEHIFVYFVWGGRKGDYVLSLVSSYGLQNTTGNNSQEQN